MVFFLIFVITVYLQRAEAEQEYEFQNLVDPKTISSYYTEIIKLEWESPQVKTGYEIVGYEILRKEGTKGNYTILVENTHSKSTKFVDLPPKKEWWGYHVLPLVQKIKHDPITSHGINRNHSLFDSYKNGQILLAQEKMNEILGGKKIQNEIFFEPVTIYDKFHKRENPKFLQALEYEKNRAAEMFKNLYNIGN